METPRSRPESESFEKNVPTRWGNQLNGNLQSNDRTLPRGRGPHSLGKPIEWKHRSPRREALT